MATTASHSILVFREGLCHLVYPLWPCPHKHILEVCLPHLQTDIVEQGPMWAELCSDWPFR